MWSVFHKAKNVRRVKHPHNTNKDKVTDEEPRVETTAGVRQINVLCIHVEDYRLMDKWKP